MNRRTMAILQGLVLLVSLSANAVEKNALIRVKVLDSETHSVVLDNSGVPKNCDAVNFDAYCHNSKTVALTNTLLLQEGDQSPFYVSCTADSKWSHCFPLQKGVSFDAKREKHGINVYFVDDKGKARQQLYTYVGGGDRKDGHVESATSAPAGGNTNPAVPSTGTSSQGPAFGAPGFPETVKCSFSSTPSGAEISVDGHYMGSTPSVLSLSAGSHTVAISLPGFTQWKRDMTVSSGSELTVNAVLEKGQ